MGQKDSPNEDSSKKSDEKKKQEASSKLNDTIHLVMKRCKELKEKPGVHSVIHMEASGFKYTGDRDTAVCKDCGLKVSDWKIEKKPFAVHSDRHPNCPFVQDVKLSVLPKNSAITGSSPMSSNSSKPDLFQQLKRHGLSYLNDITRSVLKRCKELKEKPGVHSKIHMAAAGLKYTGDRDTAMCKDCGLKVSDWEIEKKPFAVHFDRHPNCPFVQNIKLPAQSKESETTGLPSNLFEIDLLQQVRRRTFSHWPHRTLPSSAQMIEAGFFNCNVRDRVICIYCNLICQQWTPHSDDPCEVHKTLSPHCIYVKAKLIRPTTSSRVITNNHSSKSADSEPLRSNEIVFTAACNPSYAEIPKRNASFATWPNENLPSVDDLVRAGFFYTGTKSIVTCFYCNGSLQNWGPNDNPMIEHARWFPGCAYAKKLCGDELHRKIQESKRAQQGLFKHSQFEDNILFFLFSRTCQSQRSKGKSEYRYCNK